MNLKPLSRDQVSRDRILKQLLPSVFFFILFLSDAIFSKGLWSILIDVGIALLFLGNVLLSSKILSRILGIPFLLGSCYMLLAIYDDYIDGEATMGYLFGLFLFLTSVAMSILLIFGYEKESKCS
jgi:hypothetical protein